jgi:DNA helicase-2/ATP-dependent DNA helicase PcrA
MSRNTVSKPLSKPQQAAAAAILRPHPGALRVIAGAGAGKTATVVSAALEAADAGRPVRVVTFTNAAGTELRSRIARTGGRALADAIAVGTFHSGALRALPQ